MSKTRLTTERFISDATVIHNGKYDYSKTDLKKKDEKRRVLITCPVHGDFRQSPYSHLKGCGCSECGKKQRRETQTKTNEQYIAEATAVHNGKYDYSETRYCGCYSIIDIICPIHGKFQEKACVHLRGHGCKKCADEFNREIMSSNTEEFIFKARLVHSDDNDYSLVNYRDAKTPVTIICKNGHVYSQMPNKHLSGHGCPFCSKNVSSQEKEIADHIRSLGLEVVTSTRKILRNAKEIDIFIPSKNIAIEFDGLFWHSYERKPDPDYHLRKTEECERKGIRLIHIFEDEWLCKEEIVKSRLNVILGKAGNRIYARKCEIGLVDDEQCKEFLEANHLQGTCKCSVRYGLFHKGELVSVMTFGKQGKDDEYELLRFCSKLGTVVVGGASRLFQAFLCDYKPVSVISYADRRWDTGRVFEVMGFKFIHYSSPECFRIEGRQRYRYKEDNTQKIYDCGMKIYKWKNTTR